MFFFVVVVRSYERSRNTKMKKGKKKQLKEEAKTVAFAFASVAAVKNISKGEKLTKNNIFPIRPGNGYFKVKDYKKILGKISKKDIKKGNQLKIDDL